MKRYPPERVVEQVVTYVADLDGRICVIENVPARVNVETGERLFGPETVARIQNIVWNGGVPSRTIQTPVFDFAA